MGLDFWIGLTTSVNGGTQWAIPGVGCFAEKLMLCSSNSKLITSSARIATLRDTSWDRLIIHLGYHIKKNNLWLHLTSWNLPDSQLCLESKTEPSVAKGGGTPHRKQIYWKGGTPHIPYWGGDTAHTLFGWGHRTCLIGVGTPHIAYWGGDTAQHCKK